MNWSGPRSKNSMNGSPAICSEYRVQRVQEMQRSRSSRTSVEIATGLAKVRLTSVKRVSPCPFDIAWFCSGHSPPLSHMGQSSGWLMSSSSITPRCAFSATGEVSWVRTTIPSVQVVVHEASGLTCPVTSTRHCRHAPAGSSSGWSQNRGIWSPSSSAARMTSVPLGTVISNPSMVTVTPSVTGAAAGSLVCKVIYVVSLAVRCAGGAPASTTASPGAPEHRGGGRVERAAALLLVLEVLVPEVLDRRLDRADRAVAERAERPPEDVVADVQQLLQVFLAALAVFQPVQHPDHPERPLPAGRALAARLVLVELGPPQGGPDHAGGLVEDLQGPGAEQRPGRGHRFEVERDVEVLVGEDRGGRPARRPELQPVPGPNPARQIQQFAQRDAQRRLVLARDRDVPAEGEDAEPGGLLGPHPGEPGGA